MPLSFGLDVELTTKVCSNIDPRLTLTYFMASFVPNAFI